MYIYFVTTRGHLYHQSSDPLRTHSTCLCTAARMARVKNKVLVLSGKGGVGKSTVSAQLALELASRGHEVGLLDIDICGPSIPRMMGLAGQEIHQVRFHTPFTYASVSSVFRSSTVV